MVFFFSVSSFNGIFVWLLVCTIYGDVTIYCRLNLANALHQRPLSRRFLVRNFPVCFISLFFPMIKLMERNTEYFLFKECMKSRCFYRNPYYAQLSRWTFKNLLSHARTIRPIPTNLVKKFLWAKKTQMRRVMSCSRGDNSNIVKIH